MLKKEIRIVHCSDVHIGYQFKSLDLKSEKRTAELKDSFFRFLSACSQETPDLVLISGDLFDDTSVDEGIVENLKGCFSKLNSKIIISPGNHDPFVPGSPYDGQWPDNVFIFKNNKIESFLFQDIGVRVFGAAFTSRYQYESIFRNVKAPNDDFINICVIHGELSSENSGLYNPISTEDIALSGMDYVALGHIHKRSKITRIGSVYYAYPGCLEGIGMDETGEKGFYSGIVSKDLCSLSFKRICRRIISHISVDISDCKNNNECLNQILDKMKQEFGDEYSENIYKVSLKGDLPQNVILSLQDIESSLSSMVFYLKINDQTQVDLSDYEFDCGEDLKYIFVRKMKQKIDTAISEHEREVAKMALKLGIRAFSRDVKYSDYY